MYRVSQKGVHMINEPWKVIIASILKIWIGFDSESQKLNHDIKNKHFGSSVPKAINA